MTNHFPGSLSLSIRASLNWLGEHSHIQWGNDWSERRDAFFGVLTGYDDETTGATATVENALNAAFHDLPNGHKLVAEGIFYETMKVSPTKSSSGTGKIKEVARKTRAALGKH